MIKSASGNPPDGMNRVHCISPLQNLQSHQPTWREPALGPLPAPPTFALRLPNCIARLTRPAVIASPAISAASRSSRFSPSPSGKVRSHFSQIGSDDRCAMNDNDKYGYRASRANEDRIRSSREVLRVGRRLSSCWICRQRQQEQVFAHARFVLL